MKATTSPALSELLQQLKLSHQVTIELADLKSVLRFHLFYLTRTAEEDYLSLLAIELLSGNPAVVIDLAELRRCAERARYAAEKVVKSCALPARQMNMLPKAEKNEFEKINQILSELYHTVRHKLTGHEAILLYLLISGKENKEIADILKTPVNVVRARKSTLLRKLRTLLPKFTN